MSSQNPTTRGMGGGIAEGFSSCCTLLPESVGVVEITELLLLHSLQWADGQTHTHFRLPAPENITLCSSRLQRWYKEKAIYVSWIMKFNPSSIVGELHMTPLHGLVQLRPSLSHLDKTDTGSKKVGVGGVEGGAMSEGDTTGSEGEEAKPVQVRFARPDSVRASQSVRKPSYQLLEQQREEEAWVPLLYHGVDSECATEERQLLFASEENHRDVFGVTQSQYLDLVCPMERPEERGVPAAPSGVVSLSQLKMLPVPQQVQELLTRSDVIQFEKLCSLLGGRSQALVLLEAVQECGVLVQGCWVVASEVVYPGEGSSMLRSARDYIVSLSACLSVYDG